MVWESLHENSISKEFVGRRKILDEIYKSIDKRAPAVVVKGAGGRRKNRPPSTGGCSSQQKTVFLHCYRRRDPPGTDPGKNLPESAKKKN